jgi:ribose transport system permease protein
MVYGNDLCMYTCAAAVIGGCSLSGGKGSALRTFLGMIFMGLLTQFFTYVNIYIYLQEAINGLVIVFVVAMDAVSNKMRVEEMA